MAFRPLAFTALYALLMSAAPAGAQISEVPTDTSPTTPLVKFRNLKVSTITALKPTTPTPGRMTDVEARAADEDATLGVAGADEATGTAARTVAAAETVASPGGATTALNGQSDIRNPYGLSYDAARQALWVADYRNNALFRVDPATGAETRVVQGNGVTDGFNSMISPYHVQVLRSGKRRGNVAVSEHGSQRRVRVVDLSANANVTTVAGAAYGYLNGKVGRFAGPLSMATLPGDADHVYVTDYYNHCVRKIHTETQMVSHVYGRCRYRSYSLNGALAYMNSPWSLTNGKEREMLYVAEMTNHFIRSVNVTGQSGAVLVGQPRAGSNRDGRRGVARLMNPTAISRAGDVVFIVSDGSRRLSAYSLSSEYLVALLTRSTTGFVDGDAQTARFQVVHFVEAASDTTVFFSDYPNSAVRRLDVEWTEGVDTSVADNLFPDYAASASRQALTVVLGAVGTVLALAAL